MDGGINVSKCLKRLIDPLLYGCKITGICHDRQEILGMRCLQFFQGADIEVQDGDRVFLLQKPLHHIITDPLIASHDYDIGQRISPFLCLVALL